MAAFSSASDNFLGAEWHVVFKRVAAWHLSSMVSNALIFLACIRLFAEHPLQEFCGDSNEGCSLCNLSEVSQQSRSGGRIRERLAGWLCRSFGL